MNLPVKVVCSPIKLTLKLPITTIVVCFVFANSVDPEQSDLGPRCLPVCKNRFEKFARMFSRRHKQTPFSDAGFLGVLRVNIIHLMSRGGE